MNISANTSYYPNYFSGSSYSRRAFSSEKSNVSSRFGFLGIIVLLLIVVASAGYFLEINSVASLGYDIKAYQKSIDGLKAENQKMKLDIAESTSFKNIENSTQIEKMNMVSVSDYQYMAIPSSSFAKR